MGRIFDWLNPIIGMMRDDKDHELFEVYSASDIDYLRRNGIECRNMVCDLLSNAIRFVVPNDQVDRAIRLLEKR